MTLELEINAATKAFFPEGAVEFATEPERFEIIHSCSAEPISCIRKYVPWKLHPISGEQLYSPVFRPERGETDTNFWNAKPLEAKEINKFDKKPEDEMFLFFSHRMWQPPQSSIIIGFDSSNFGIIYYANNRMLRIRCEQSSDTMRVKNPEQDLEWFMKSNFQFESAAQQLFDDEQSEMRFAIDWLKLNSDQKDDYAFKCQTGDWDEFIQVTTWLLYVYISRIKPILEYAEWNVISNRVHMYPYIPTDFEVFKSLQGLLVLHFQPKCLEMLPMCVGNYAQRKGSITIKNVTRHELLEAQLLLSQWANENLSIEAAKQLLDF